MGNTEGQAGTGCGQTPADANAYAKWLSDPFVSRAADRSKFDENGDVLLLLETLSDLMAEVEAALPGVPVAALRAQLSAAPELVDAYALHRQLTQAGRTRDEATEICVAVSPDFVPPSEHQTQRMQTADERRVECVRLLKEGHSRQQVASIMDVSLARVSQIRVEAGLRPGPNRKYSPERLRAIAAAGHANGVQPTARLFGCAVATVRGAMANNARRVVAV